jgi:hypothetical protein
MPAKLGDCLNMSLADSASVQPGCCLLRCLHQPAGHYRSVSASRVVCRTWASQRRHLRAISYRTPSVQRASLAQTAYIRDTVHQKQSERDRIRNASHGILKNFKIFKKSKNAGNCPKSSQNQRNLKNFIYKFFFGFVHFSDNFQHYLLFRKF